MLVLGLVAGIVMFPVGLRHATNATSLVTLHHRHRRCDYIAPYPLRTLSHAVLVQMYVYKAYTAHILTKLKEEQNLALQTLDNLGKSLSNMPCKTLLHVAAAAGKEDVVKALLDRGLSLELVDSRGRNAHALSTSAAVAAALDTEVKLLQAIDSANRQAHDLHVGAEVMARDSSGNYRLGTMVSMAPDHATCTVKFLLTESDGSTEDETRVCGSAHVLTMSQWRAYTNRSSHLLRQALNMKGLLAQVPQYGASPAERRQGFGELVARQAHLLPMMSVVGYDTLFERLQTSGSIPHSSEMVTVPVTTIPSTSKVIFFSHTRLQDSKPDNQHNVKLQGIVEAMQVISIGWSPICLHPTLDRNLTPDPFRQSADVCK